MNNEGKRVVENQGEQKAAGQTRGDLFKRAKTEGEIHPDVPFTNLVVEETVAPTVMKGKELNLVLPSTASWFQLATVHDYEKEALPEFFNLTDPLKTEAVYRDYRDFMVHAYWQRPQQHLSYTACRRSLAGDVCAILRVHQFLEHRGVINCLVSASHVPPAGPPQPNVEASLGGKQTSVQGATQGEKHGDDDGWTTEQNAKLLSLVEQHPNNWAMVAAEMGRSELECLMHFIRMPLPGSQRVTTTPLSPVASDPKAMLNVLTALLPVEVGRSAAAAVKQAESDDAVKLAAEGLEAARQKAELLAKKEEQLIQKDLAQAVELLLQGLQARMKRFADLEAYVTNRRDGLKRENLETFQKQ